MATQLNLVPKNPTPLIDRIAHINISGVLVTVVAVILVLASIMSFISLILGGLQWILSGGEKDGVEKAKKRIISAIVGLSITFSAFAIIYLVQNIFGISITTFTIPQVPTGSINGV